MATNRNVFLNLSRNPSISVALRASLYMLALILVLGQSGCDGKSRSDARRDAFLDRLSWIETLAEQSADHESEFLRFMAEQTLVAAAKVREEELWSQGAGYLVFQRDDAIGVRGEWIADAPDGDTMAVTHNGVHIGTFDLYDYDIENNYDQRRPTDNFLGSAQFDFSFHVQYGSELEKQILDGVNAQTLEFSVRHNDKEVAVLRDGFIYDARE